jgi:hypothetical protein
LPPVLRQRILLPYVPLLANFERKRALKSHLQTPPLKLHLQTPLKIAPTPPSNLCTFHNPTPKSLQKLTNFHKNMDFVSHMNYNNPINGILV